MNKLHAAIAFKLKATMPYVPTGTDAEGLTGGEITRRRGRYDQWTHDVVCIGDVLAESGRFDRTLFYRLAGVDGAA